MLNAHSVFCIFYTTAHTCYIVHIHVYTSYIPLGDYFLWVLIFFAMFADWPQNTDKIVITNVSYVYYQTLKNVNSVPYLRNNLKI